MSRVNMSSFKQLLSDGQLWFGSSFGARPLRTERGQEQVREPLQLSRELPAAPSKVDRASEVDRASQANRAPGLVARFGIDTIDSHFRCGGLSAGAVHELTFESVLSSKSKSFWQPPACVLTSIVGHTLHHLDSSLLERRPLLAWVGERSWPTPYLIDLFLRHPHWSWESSCLFIHTEKNRRLWTITQLLQSPACLGVIADGSGLNLVATRRIQLAAQKQNALCFLMRPPWDLERPSAAHTRWRIATDTEEIESPLKTRWEVELTHAKGAPCPATWLLQISNDYEQKASLSLVQESREPRRARQAQERVRAVGV